MTQPVPAGDAPPVRRPLFFVGHADREDDALFKRFFRDLTRAVAGRLKLGVNEQAGLGYMVDAASSPDETARALSVCQVFVPLWSPLYFKSPQCGQEWSVFRERTQAAGSGFSDNLFAPVIWTPVSAAALPRAAREVDRGGGREERPDSVYGLYELMVDMPDDEISVYPPLGNDDYQYRQVVDGVAEAIARAARAPALHSATPVDVRHAVNAFAQRAPSLYLRVAILAPRTGRIPPGRTDTRRYGEAALDWAPYGNRALAEDVETVTERLGYLLHLVDFDDVAERLQADEDDMEPTLLLIDNWALLDEGWRERVDRYVRLDRPWHTFMVIRDPNDTETRENLARLLAVVDGTLSARLDRMRVDLAHAASGNGSPEGFTRDFSALAQVAESRFVRR